MSDKPPATRVPTLTEVLAVDSVPPAAEAGARAEPRDPVGAAIDTDRLSEEFLQSLSPKLAGRLERILAEVLAPQLSAALAVSARAEFEALLREELSLALARELARRN